MSQKAARISKGSSGWGGPLVVKPEGEKKYVISVTGGGIDPLAQKIADITGTEAIDAFNNPVPKEETFVAVVNCGGTARSGVYPKMGIPTVNTVPVTPAGPLAKFIKEEIFVSGVTLDGIEEVDGIETPNKKIETEEKVNDDPNLKTDTVAIVEDAKDENIMLRIIDKVGKAAGSIVNVFYQAGRDTIDTLIKNILPFMAFVATLVGIINYSGLGNLLAHVFTPLAGNIIGLIVLSLICALPFLSPILGPAGVIAAVVGTLIGQQIATGNVPMYLALPALFAIDAQVGCDFIPVGLTLGEAKPETINTGTTAVLISRVVTGPIAVIIAYAFSFLLK
ncbi:PTS glucitol/sorbitol transporter subunit IIB [Ligilactobacillus salivarius]|uniref:PTS glucitol/sorbitol transporter subunit IIB n=1 Tax=Ligilactobacillus salivarius TaxID=1624 RepID=UPI0030FBE537